ncbi:MAG: phosphoadenosine phosphosulfate reductase family protein [Anaeroplasma bactoclasticum]|nr:phosphoadenosine phosphosulfate reductase family protein [Anaeroplasma bactoclasticum]
MYSYEWDEETGGILLNSTPLQMSKEPRPVYYKELDILGFDKYWKYDKDDSYPYMWAEANNYFYRGRLVGKTRGGTMCTAPEIIIVEDPEPNGAKLQFVDVNKMVEKNRTIIDQLAQHTIKKTYSYYLNYQNKVDVFYVAFSGGKDSVVALDIVQRTLPHNEFLVLFGDTGMEFSDTYDTAKIIEKQCEQNGIKFLTAKSNLDPTDTWRMFGPPAQRMRWCCSVHKSTPQILELRRYLHNDKFKGMAFTGVRADESEARSEYEEVNNGEKVKGQYSCHPILEWNSAELFLYIYQNNLYLNKAYKKGNSRAGCLICPLAGQKNSYIKSVCYNKSICGENTTKTFNDIILETTSKTLSSQNSIEEFMNIGGWKARRSGRELNIAKDIYSDEIKNGVLTITIKKNDKSWKEWIKTIGKIISISDTDVKIEFQDKIYIVDVKYDFDKTSFVVDLASNTRNDIYFCSYLKIVARKSCYCIGCRVCEANCPNGFISFKNGQVFVDDKCVKCKKCYEVDYGCLVANSLKLPKGEKKMGSIDRYTNLGVEYDWIKEYFEKKDSFWENHNLGSKKIDVFKNFLKDSGVSEKNVMTKFGYLVANLGAESATSWGLMLSNLAYTPEFNWWIKNIELNSYVDSTLIINMLDSNLTGNTKDHVASAFKNIFISNKPLSEEIGLGVCDYEIKNGKRKLNSIMRRSWIDPDPKVILYSLYKFAENCGNYYQFSLTRLLNHSIESDGISPTEIFGLNRETMEKVLQGLAINYPEYISVSFTLDLDNINLRNDKTSDDVLEIF